MTDHTILRPKDVAAAEEAWQLYKVQMRDHPRRQLRKRDLTAGFLAGVAHERARQQQFVHPAIATIQNLLDFHELQPEQFFIWRRNNQELINRLMDAL